MSWPVWWEWELEFTSHLERRTEDRGFTEVDLRAMLEHAATLQFDVVPGRFVVDTRHRGRPWQVVVEPDARLRRVVVVTAFPVDRS